MSGYRTIIAWMVAGLLALPALAAGSTILGSVTLPDGTALPGVQVEVTGEALAGESRTVLTDAAGRFRIDSLRPGRYVLYFRLDGFATDREEVTLSAGRSMVIDVEMPFSAMAEEIVVHGDRQTEATVFRRARCRTVLDLLPDEADGGPVVGFRPICFLGEAAYAFNVPPALRYLERQDLLFRVDPTSTALEAKEDLEGLDLSGSVEAATGPWSRCMEAELVETTLDSPLRARPATRKKLRIRPLVRSEDDRRGNRWVPGPSNAVMVHKMGRHPTDWRWRITGVKEGRTQLALRLYAVAVLDGSKPGEPVCASPESRGPDGSRRRVRTLQRRLSIEVSTAEWMEARLWSPFLWSLLLPPAGLLLAWWRRRRGRPVLGRSSPSPLP